MSSLPFDPARFSTLDLAAFDALLGSGGPPLLVDFFATWCGPCAWILPTLHTLADAHAGNLRIVKIDVDASPELAIRYRIGSVPTVVLFSGGVEMDRSVGVEPERVQSMVERVFSAKS